MITLDDILEFLDELENPYLYYIHTNDNDERLEKISQLAKRFREQLEQEGLLISGVEMKPAFLFPDKKVVLKDENNKIYGAQG